MSYSQNAEESVILDSLKNFTKGKFLDIGAYDTFRFSNVRALYETGKWKGVLVEPAPQNYRAIADHYKDDPEMIVLNVAIGENSSEIDFYESDGDAVSTSDEDHMKKWRDAGVKYTKIRVPQMSVVDFFNKYGKGTSFLSVDVEATNLPLFRLIPDWMWEEISLFCIEHDNEYEEIENKLSKFGFAAIYMNAENIILGKV
jgi:FkbM family methyltransferase